VNFYLNINLHNVLAKFFGFLFNFLYSMKLVICYRWAGGFMGWGQQCRLRHVTSGRYLAESFVFSKTIFKNLIER
jgi:hypothetical protein